jgi:hypothetical protein
MANTRRRTQRTTRTATRSAAARSGGAGAAVMESEEARLGRQRDWQNEFKYISGDLRQLLIVSTILFVLLFVVGFFL